MIENILLAFIPIFVTVDAIGTLPIFVSLTKGLSQNRKRNVIFQSVVTALCLAFGFMALGKWIFKVLGITISDFMIAGGAILFCIAIIDLLSPEERKSLSEDEMGAVPIGTPLMVGPAVLTTTLMSVDQYGLIPTVIAVLGNVILAGIIFTFSDVLIQSLGKSGSRALSKVMALLLAAIAIMMIRKGITQILSGNF